MFTPAMAVLAVICEPILFGFDGASFSGPASDGFMQLPVGCHRHDAARATACLAELSRHVVHGRGLASSGFAQIPQRDPGGVWRRGRGGPCSSRPFAFGGKRTVSP